MKLCLMLSLGTMLFCSNVSSEECISHLQTFTATWRLCREHRDNKVLWQRVIDCHIPISHEFMRNSRRAQCPIKKRVQDPTNTDYSIQDVFLNICGFLFDVSLFDQIRGGACLLAGRSKPYVMSHFSEVAAVRQTWGNDITCNIGKCILKLGLN